MNPIVNPMKVCPPWCQDHYEITGVVHRRTVREQQPEAGAAEIGLVQMTLSDRGDVMSFPAAVCVRADGTDVDQSSTAQEVAELLQEIPPYLPPEVGHAIEEAAELAGIELPPGGTVLLDEGEAAPSAETLQAAVDTMRGWAREGRRVVLDLDALTAHTLIGLLQLVTRHPSAPMLHVAEEVGRDLQAKLCADDVQMTALMEAGWNPAADMTAAEFAAAQGDDVQPCGENSCICYCVGECPSPCGCDCPRDEDGQLRRDG